MRKQAALLWRGACREQIQMAHKLGLKEGTWDKLPFHNLVRGPPRGGGHRAAVCSLIAATGFTPTGAEEVAVKAVIEGIPDEKYNTFIQSYAADAIATGPLCGTGRRVRETYGVGRECLRHAGLWSHRRGPGWRRRKLRPCLR